MLLMHGNTELDLQNLGVTENAYVEFNSETES
jgi:hypothetical protein